MSKPSFVLPCRLKGEERLKVGVIDDTMLGEDEEGANQIRSCQINHTICRLAS